jgi:hypothetical protein
MTESRPSTSLRLADGRSVVLDPAWTPGSGDDPTIPIRPIARRVLAAHDPHGEALLLANQLADQAGLDEALAVDGTSLWPRRRLVAWRRIHDLILWRGILAELGIAPGDPVELNDVPTAIRDLLGRSEEAVAPPPAAAPSLLGRVFRRARRTVAAPPKPPATAAALAEAADPLDTDADRLAAWFGHGRHPLLVLSDSAVDQTVDTPEGTRRLDPFLGPIVEQLRGSALNPVVLGLDGDGSGGDRRVSIKAVTGLPADPDDVTAAEVASTEAGDRLLEASAVIDLAGIDVGLLLVEEERTFAATSLARWLLARARIERFLDAHRPAGLLLINEYSRPEWVSAARRKGIPVAAVQHGIIHRHHAGYVLPRRTDGLVLPDRTYVFGDFERRLLTEGVYLDDEVVVAGSPRLDLLGRHDAALTDEDAADLREATRAFVGARPGERLVVVSSTSNADIRRLVVAPILETILDRALPNVRLVIKLHPAEEPHDLYQRVTAGLAARGGFEPPPISVIRDIDLFGLLRAADAHLGIHSTVLSDAVVAGVRNLIVAGFPGGDLLGYVERGVARPIRDGGDLLDALAAPPPAADDPARLAFLAEQLQPGDASERIAADLSGWLGG